MKKSSFNALLVALVVFSFFLPPALKGKVPIPADSILALYHPFRDIELDGYNRGKFPAKNPHINDPVLQTYEWRSLVFKNIKSQNLPLWNPYSFSGQPLFANFQSAALQITNILFLFLPFKLGWAISVILPPIVLSVFMFLMLKELKISKEASIFGAIVLPFSGFFMPWLTWGTIVTSAMWLPLLILSTLKLQSKLNAWWFLILAFSSAFTILSGHAQTALYVFLAACMFSLFQFITTKNLKVLCISQTAMFLGVLISAVQIIPFLEFLKLSARGIDLGYFPGREDWFLPAFNLVQLIAPDFFGNPTTNNYWGVWNYWEFASFIGIVPLAFALFAILKTRGKSFFVALGVFSLLIALANPISKIPYVLNFSAISTMQPSRIIFLFVFSLVVLSAYGLDLFLKEKKSKFYLVPIFLLLTLGLVAFSTTRLELQQSNIAQRNLVIPAVTIIFLIFASVVKVFKNNAKFFLIFIYLVTIIELFRFAYKFTPFSKPSWIFPQTQITNFLANQQKPFRVMTTDRRVMHPNISSAYNIESTDGYDPIYLASYAKLVSAWQSNDPNSKATSFNRIVTPQRVNSPVTDFLNVKYILSLDELKGASLEKIQEEGETKLYLNLQAKPRAFFVDEVLQVNSDADEISQLLKGGPATSQVYGFEKQEIIASADIQGYDDQKTVITTSANIAAPLVITVPFYPGWNSYIDGIRSEVKEADFMFLSTIVPAGNHKVEFKFEPESFYNGLKLSILGLVMTILMSILIWKKKYL
ncbi:MAG: YfhO family protein [Candidatus Curtissbacteria bacterium]|nr:YfhO family protein [Candidatus Curtissbacteria bacterium]